MQSRAAKTKSGKTVYIAVIDDDFKNAVWADNAGMCVACGDFQDGCEPDAREYKCDSCGERRVYGLEELVLMGYAK